MIEPHLANLVAGRATDVLAKGLVQPAPGHPGRARHLLHADRAGEILRNKAQPARHTVVLYREDVAALARDHLRWRNAHGFGWDLGPAHHPIQQRGALVSLLLQVCIDAGDRAIRCADRKQVVVDADDRDLVRNAEARLFAHLLHLHREGAVGGKDRERLFRRPEMPEQPRAAAQPQTGRTLHGILTPAQPVALLPRGGERLGESFASLELRPILRVAIKAELPQAAGEEMLGDELPGFRVFLHHVPEREVRAAQREIDGRLLHRRDKVREVLSRREPGEHAVAFPAPGDHFFVDDAVGRKVPPMLRGIRGDPLQQPVIIPAERDENILLVRFHASEIFAGASCGTSRCITASASR